MILRTLGLLGYTLWYWSIYN